VKTYGTEMDKRGTFQELSIEILSLHASRREREYVGIRIMTSHEMQEPFLTRSMF
jgi:hypothetical protein